jgi:hypothetical protein
MRLTEKWVAAEQMGPVSLENLNECRLGLMPKDAKMVRPGVYEWDVLPILKSGPRVHEEEA